MKRIPCIICKKLVETDEEKDIATVCPVCNKSDIGGKLKNLNYKEVKKLIPKVRKDGRIVNEYGEVI